MPNGIQLSSGVVVGSPIPLDAKYGPYSSTALALADITPSLRYKGLTVGVLVNNAVVEYWFRGGVLDTDFVVKQAGATTTTVTDQLPTPVLRVRHFSGSETEPYPELDMLNMTTGLPLATKLSLRSAPEIIVQDIPLDILSSYGVFLECAVLTKNKRDLLKSYVVPSSSTGTLNGTVWTPTWTKPWPIQGYSRSGHHNLVVHTSPSTTTVIPIKVNRPNHFAITANNVVISLTSFLNGRFTLEEVLYRDTNPSTQLPRETDIELPIPVGIRRSKKLSTGLSGARHPYSARFAPLRIAARYMIWKPGAIAGSGTFVVGPFSSVAKIWMHPFPFNVDHFASSIHGEAIAKINPAFETSGMMQTWIE